MFGASFFFKIQGKAQTQRISWGVLGGPKFFMLKFFMCSTCALIYIKSDTGVDLAHAELG